MSDQFPTISFEDLSQAGADIRQLIEDSLSPGSMDPDASENLLLLQVCNGNTRERPPGELKTEWESTLTQNWTEAIRTHVGQKISENFLHINAPRAHWELMLRTASARIEKAKKPDDYIQIGDAFLALAILGPNEDFKASAAKKWAEFNIEQYGNKDLFAHSMGQVMLARNYFPQGWAIQRQAREVFISMHPPGTIPEEEIQEPTRHDL